MLEDTMNELIGSITGKDVMDAIFVVVLALFAIGLMLALAMALSQRTCPACRSKNPIPLKNPKQWRCPDCRCIFEPDARTN